MVRAKSSPYLLLLLLYAAVFLAMTAALMLGPLLVELAREFNTSVAVSGQLAAAGFLTWGFTAPLVGPVSDTYGRRPVAVVGLTLMAVGVLASALAWNYPALLAFRLVTGVGAGMIPPNSIAAVADHFPPETRGRAISWMVSSVRLGPVLGLPLVALLADAGGWRLPFYAVGGLILVVLGMLWVWFPRVPQPRQPFSFFAHFKDVGRRRSQWYLLATIFLSQTAFFGTFIYLAPYLIQSYQLTEGETALPLALAGSGAVAGSLVGGSVAGRARRRAIVATVLVGGGLFVGLAFSAGLPPWPVVVVSFVALGAFSITLTVLAAMIIELAGRSRATAIGLFAAGNQLGGVVGTSVGGLMLSLGGFPLLGFLCLGLAVLAGLVMGVKVRDSPEFHQRVMNM